MRHLAIGLALCAACASSAAAQLSGSAATPAQAKASATGTTIVAADMFYLRDASRTPIRRLPAGATVRVLAREGSWFQLVFVDPRFGDEVGYVRAASVRLDSGAGDLEGGQGVLSQRGFIEAGVQAFPREANGDAERLIADALWREELQLKPAKWLQLSAGLDVRGNSHDQVVDDWSIDTNDRGIQRPRVSLRRVAATITAGKFSLDAGKQFVRWGKADVLNPTDRFSPRDYVNVLDSQFLPVWAVRTSLQLGEETFEAVYVPQFTPSRLPLLSQRWTVLPAAASGIPIDDRGAVFPDRGQTGGRWNHVGSSFESSLSVFDGFNHLPDIEGHLDATGTIAITRTYPRVRSYGADIAIPTRLVTIKGETAFFTSPTSTGDEHVLYVVELERQAGEWLFDFGYAGERVTTDRGEVSFAAERGIARSIIGRAAYTVDPRRSVTVESAVRQDGHGVYVKGEYSQSFGQHMRLTLSGVGIGGKADDFLGQFRDNYHATTSVRLSF